MKDMVLLILLILMFSNFVVAQRYVYNKNVMTAMYDMNHGDLDTESCGRRNITGKIYSIDEDYPILTAVLLGSEGKEPIILNTESMSMADRSNFFYSLIKKGKRVQIGAYVCGSGGFTYVRSVKSLGIVNSKRK